MEKNDWNSFCTGFLWIFVHKDMPSTVPDWTTTIYISEKNDRDDSGARIETENVNKQYGGHNAEVKRKKLK